MTSQQLRDDVMASELMVARCRDEEDVAAGRLRVLGPPQECPRCLCAPGTESALLCVPHSLAMRAYQKARERHDAARIALLFARAREMRMRRVA